MDQQPAAPPEVVQTDLGRMAYNVARFRLSCFLVAAVAGAILLAGLVCVALLGLFAINASSPLFKPTPGSTPTPVVRPTPTRPPGGVAPAAVGVLATALLSRPGAVVVPRVPGVRAARRASRGEGKIKATPRTRGFANAGAENRAPHPPPRPAGRGVRGAVLQAGRGAHAPRTPRWRPPRRGGEER